jgi:endonuclease/exonuclease/phosphatase (EEP) superfamily protein YafD
MRYVAGQPVEQIFPGVLPHPGPDLPPGAALTNSNVLRIMVWNIFKQQRADWLSVLQGFGKDAQLVLLQEAQTTPELIRFATSNFLAADQVPAFVLPQHPSGVKVCVNHRVSLNGWSPVNGSQHSRGEFQHWCRRLQ